MVHNEFVYDYVVLARTKLAKIKRTRGKFRRNFPSTHKSNNELYTVLQHFAKELSNHVLLCRKVFRNRIGEKLNFSFAFTIDREKCFLKRFVAFSV